MQMQSSSIYALLDLYKRLSFSLESCGDAQKCSLDASALRINEFLKQMQRSNRTQAWLQLGAGVLGGMGNVTASALQNVNNLPIKIIGQVVAPLLSKGPEFFLTLERGNENRLQSLNTMERDHKLAMQKELRSSLTASDNEISQKIQRIQETKAQGDRLH